MINKLKKISIFLLVLIFLFFVAFSIIRYNYRIIIIEHYISMTNGIATKKENKIIKKNNVENYILEKENKTITLRENETENILSYNDLAICVNISSQTKTLIDENFIIYNKDFKVEYETSNIVECLTFLNNGRKDNFIDLYKLSSDIENNLGENNIIWLEDYYIEK